MPEFTLDLLLLVLATVLIAIEMILIIRRKREKLATVPRSAVSSIFSRGAGGCADNSHYKNFRTYSRSVAHDISYCADRHPDEDHSIQAQDIVI